MISSDPAALGCMLMGTTINQTDSFAILDEFTANGLSHLDTANCYAWWVGKGEFVGDESEAMIGRWLQARQQRNHVYLATKVGARIRDLAKIRDAHGVPLWEQIPRHYEGCSAAMLRSALAGSLRRLGTDYVDLPYIHVDDLATPLEETLATLSEFVREGRVRELGFSNVSTERLAEISRLCTEHGWILPIAVQQEFSYLSPKPGLDRGIVRHADNRMRQSLDPSQTLVAYSPLLKGLYASLAKRISTYIWPDFDHPANHLRLEVLETAMQDSGIDGNTLVLAWILAQRPRVVPVLGFSSQRQFQENLRAVQLQLPPATLSALNRVFAETAQESKLTQVS